MSLATGTHTEDVGDVVVAIGTGVGDIDLLSLSWSLLKTIYNSNPRIDIIIKYVSGITKCAYS